MDHEPTAVQAAPEQPDAPTRPTALKRTRSHAIERAAAPKVERTPSRELVVVRPKPAPDPEPAAAIEAKPQPVPELEATATRTADSDTKPETATVEQAQTAETEPAASSPAQTATAPEAKPAGGPEAKPAAGPEADSATAATAPPEAEPAPVPGSEAGPAPETRAKPAPQPRSAGATRFDAGTRTGGRVTPTRPDPIRPPAAAPAPAPPRPRATLGRRRLLVVLAFVLLAAVIVGVGQMFRSDDPRRATVPPVASVPPGPQTDGTAPASAAPAAAAPPDVVGEFTFAGGYGPVLGTGGALRPFKVSVETALGLGDGAAFADEVERILGDPRSWIGGGDVRLQRVPAAAASDFTVYLASAQTSERMCRAGGLETGAYSSCRLPGQLIINRDRWEDAVLDYGAPLETYRAYAINHEVGHQLGHGHEGCPGAGRPAPVMQQQTYGLNGCVANSWPYIDGQRYTGPPAA